MWCHLPTGFTRRTTLRYVALLPIFIALFTTLILPYYSATAAPGINQTLNFQGRLLRSTGGVVPDGYYNIQFKIYEGGTGQAAGNPGGNLAWTETYINGGGTAGVQVKNGLMSVNLGSKTPFANSVDWNNDTLWLSMNVAGSTADCTAFDAGTCAADGEMTPMKRLTSTPYALNAGALQGKKAENFVQLAQGMQTDVSNFSNSVAINKTGVGGNFLELQSNGSSALTIAQSGDIMFGYAADHQISIAPSAPNTDGRILSVSAGAGGFGDGSRGGALNLSGGNGGGTNGNGGDVLINGGGATGNGTGGNLYFGIYNTGNIQLGSSDNSKQQTITIGNNTNASGTTNIVIGSTGSAGAGTTKIQAKDSTTIATNGVDRATFDNAGNLTLGNGTSSATPSDFTIQGTASSASGVSGGELTVQGGNATTGNADGGDLRLSGGNANGTGSDGLVIIDSPTYTTSDVQTSATNTTITQANIDSRGVVTLSASASNLSFTVPNPSRGAGAAGRVVYVTAAAGSQDFILRANVGAGANGEQAIPMKQNSTTTLLWNGSLWTVAGGSSSNLQSAYDNSIQADGSAKIVLDDAATTKGLTVRNSPDSSPTKPVLEVQGSSGSNIFAANSGSKEYAVNGGAEDGGSTPQEFAQPSWGSAGALSVERYTNPDQDIATGQASVRISSTAQFSGAYNTLSEPLEPNTTYNVAVAARLNAGSAAFTDFGIVYTPDGSNNPIICKENITLTSDRWQKITCTFTTPASGITAENIVATGQLSSSTPHTYYVDNLSVTKADNTAPNVQIGGGSKGGDTTLLTLDRSSSAPISGDNADLLGSLYYDTTLGKIQCYEADGWGSCGASPDNIESMTPEYSGAVMHGTGVGAMTADFCSDDLNINADICDTNDTFNYYQWTSPQTTTQEYGIYVTYKLPSTFRSFNPGSTALHGLTDDADSSVSYEVYRSDDNGLTQCGSAVAVSTGAQTNWQTGVASGGADPSACNFDAGDSLVVKVIVQSRNNANAYVGNLDFAFSNR